MRSLIDEALLSGTYGVSTLLRPQRAVRCIDVDNISGVLGMIQYLCQVWGGQNHPIIPVSSRAVPEPYRQCLHREQYDVIDREMSPDDIPGDGHLDLPARISQEPAWDHPALIIAAHRSRDRWGTVEVAELEDKDPWQLIYAAILGVLSRNPDAALSEFVDMRSDLTFDEIVPTQFVQVSGSLEDLLARQDKRGALSPRQFAGSFLAAGLEPDTSFLGFTSPIPTPYEERRATGPNIVVVVSPGNVADIALLWNLRAAHGDRRSLPIGLPADQVTAENLGRIQRPGIATAFGLGGGACRLTSTSVPLTELEQLASLYPAIKAVPYRSLLTFGPAAGRYHNQVATFTDGRARLTALTDSDRELFTFSQFLMRQPQLCLDVRVREAPLPADLTMRGAKYAPSFQAGSAQVRVDITKLDSVEVRWPSSWTALAAVARTLDLQVTQSEAGLAASTLLRSLGSIDAVRWLLHPGLIDLLYRLGERSGMSWQKAQLNSLRRRIKEEGGDTAAIEAAQEELATPSKATTPAGEGRALPFNAFRSVLKTERATARWVLWAERHHLLVRGVDIDCIHCGAKSWLPMASVPPPIGCPGCGRLLNEPYAPHQLLFTYRLGEPLRRVLETDSLGHVFALHWLEAQFRGVIVGAHPGVAFNSLSGKSTKGETLGEADVLLLFEDGRLVPTEVKLTAAGIDSRAVDLLDKLSNALRAPFDIFAVCQPARDYSNPLEAIQATDRSRFMLSYDQILEPQPRWAAGSDPFAWEPLSTDKYEARSADFVKSLERADPDEAWDVVQDTLLSPDF